MRKASSSTHPATCGKTLLTQRPHCPYCFQVNGDFMTAPGVLVTAALMPKSTFCPCRFASSGL